MRYIYIFIIGLISVYDNCMSVIYKNELMDLEENAIGRWLLRQGLDVFVEAKAIGTFACLLLCLYISTTKYKTAIPIVCIVQITLFWYLTFYKNGAFDHRLEIGPMSAFIDMQMNR